MIVVRQLGRVRLQSGCWRMISATHGARGWAVSIGVIRRSETVWRLSFFDEHLDVLRRAIAGFREPDLEERRNIGTFPIGRDLFAYVWLANCEARALRMCRKSRGERIGGITTLSSDEIEPLEQALLFVERKIAAERAA